MRIKKQCQRRAQGQGCIGAVGARGIGAGSCQQQFLHRDPREDLAEAPELDRNDDHRGESGEIDQDILDDRDRGRCAQTARIGKGGQDHERDDQRQISRKPGARHAERADHDLQADELKGDVGHRRDDAGNRDCQGEPAVAEAAAHEIARSDIVVLMANVPDAWKDQEKDRISHNRIGYRKERDGAGTKGECRNSNESIGRVEIAADEKPGDKGAEALSAEPPLAQQVEIAFAPVGRSKTQPGYKGKQQDEDRQSGPIHVLHDIPPLSLWRSLQSFDVPVLIFGRKINDRGEEGADDYPEELIPVEERYADPIGFYSIVEGRPEYGDKLDKKEQMPPAPRAPLPTWSDHFLLPRGPPPSPEGPRQRIKAP